MPRSLDCALECQKGDAPVSAASSNFDYFLSIYFCGIRVGALPKKRVEKIVAKQWREQERSG